MSRLNSAGMVPLTTGTSWSWGPLALMSHLHFHVGLGLGIGTVQRLYQKSSP